MLAISDRIVQPDADRMGRAAIIEALILRKCSAEAMRA
jgi:hypothetical protein